MNWIDIVILAAVVFALISGFQRGAIMQAFGWGGFLVGLIAGAALAPVVVEAFKPRTDLGKTGMTLGIFLGIAFVIEGIVAAFGLKLRKKVKNQGARHADAAIGALIGVFFVFSTAWFLGYQFRRGPSAELAQQIRQSKILQAADRIAPNPPGFLAAIGRFLNHTGFPEVFAQLNPSLAPGAEAPPPGIARDPDIVAAAALTFKIESKGCGGVVDGSGFPLDDRTVITAAHVVAGTRDHRVMSSEGSTHRAVVVFMDTNKDIAVLRVDRPLGSLAFEDAVAARNTPGAAIGYPGGGKRTTSPAVVRTETEALGRDIYSNKLVSRRVYVLDAHVIQGNSGGPFVDVEGRVRGMVFAASASRKNEAYALSGSEVQRALRLSRGKSSAVATGRCAIT